MSSPRIDVHGLGGLWFRVSGLVGLGGLGFRVYWLRV